MVSIPPRDRDFEPWASLRPGIMRRLRQQLRGLSDACCEDVAQDVLLALHLFMARHGAPADLEALVTVLCRRRGASALRRALVERAHFVRDEHAIAHAESPWRLPDEACIARDTARLSRRLLERIHAQESRCEPIALGLMHGLDYRAIAQGAGISAVAARQSWHRCALRLRAALRRGEFEREGGKTPLSAPSNPSPPRPGSGR